MMKLPASCSLPTTKLPWSRRGLQENGDSASEPVAVFEAFVGEASDNAPVPGTAVGALAGDDHAPEVVARFAEVTHLEPG